MLPIGPLMIEHRLIERMISLIGRESGKIENKQKPDVKFIDAAVDFIRTYADACHHGKEEDILFRDLGRKPLSDEHKKTMNELIREHVHARRKVRELIAARDRYMDGEDGAISEIIGLMKVLAEFYPRHIVKEDEHFFIPVMDYFDKQELDGMLNECVEFDRKFVHDKYRGIVKQFEVSE